MYIVTTAIMVACSFVYVLGCAPDNAFWRGIHLSKTLRIWCIFGSRVLHGFMMGLNYYVQMPMLKQARAGLHKHLDQRCCAR